MKLRYKTVKHFYDFPEKRLGTFVFARYALETCALRTPISLLPNFAELLLSWKIKFIWLSVSNFILGTASLNFKQDGATLFFLGRKAREEKAFASFVWGAPFSDISFWRGLVAFI